MFPGILVSLPLFSFKHLTIIKTDIFGHVCICCRQLLVTVRMSVKQTRHILGLVWVRNKFCVTPKSSRILPDAPTTELLVWGFCFALPFLFSAQLSHPLAAQSPGYLQSSGWWLFQGSCEPWILQTMPRDRVWARQQHYNAYLVLPDQGLYKSLWGICDYGGVSDVSFPVCALKMPDSPRLSSAIFF